jgi:EAL domain-containing protein (putative c-di-GMP-specific phosphodiesterase class I)
MKIKITKLIALILNVNKKKRTFIILFNLCLVVVIFLFVYVTGGSKYVYAHTMYIPILIAGICLGWKWGLIFAIASGLILGPLMPLDVATGEAQQFINWLYRMIIFSIVAVISGAVSDALREYIHRIIEVASHHQLTNLPNLNSLKTKTIEGKRSVVSIHIKNYENVISLLGLDFYTHLMQAIYHNLVSTLPTSCTIVQNDSYKFWISMPLSTLEKDVDEVQAALSHFLIIQGIPIYVEYGLGANEYSSDVDYVNAKTYQIADDLARLATKRNVPYLLYDEKMNLHEYDIDLISSFKQALESGELYLDYQPKINLKTHTVNSFEALIRWNHPTRGLIMPDHFIHLIEETQLIDDLTTFVIKQVIKKIQEFKKANLDISISINLSIKNFINEHFIDNIFKTVHEEEINPKSIEFEITESILIDNTCKKQIDRLYQAGFIISIDDFGKGYSSMSYLSDLLLHRVKIDKYFIMNIVKNNAFKQIVKASIDLAHNLGYEVIAEGVEDEQANNLIKDLQCDYAQGYYYAKPLKAKTIIEWAKNFVR